MKNYTEKEFTVAQINSKLQSIRCYYGSDEDSDFSQDGSVASQSIDTPACKKKKRNATENVMHKAVSLLSSIEQSGKQRTGTPEQAEDEDMTYAKHIANEMRKIRDARAKALVKIKIQQLIFEAQFQTPLSTTSMMPSHHDAIASSQQNQTASSDISYPLSHMIDTGATINCCSRSRQLLNIQEHEIKSPPHGDAVGVGGELHPILGQIDLLVTIGELTVHQGFYVFSKLHQSLIMVIDFMEDSKVLLILDNKTIVIPDKTNKEQV
ncbi:hypothetical protein KUTeg_002749 [Tegillarca granosa]|uniref:Uncharacterized protein n=1 Tax=Tegillarca granosa TaxID=220873 RepID=A0ABQ9FU97_TEGGR|nr:hypothetical protein KUTeg_002749 [Tegillarca granosa]